MRRALLSLSLLVGLAGDLEVLADEVLYCSESYSTGLGPETGTGEYKPTNFQPSRFTIKLVNIESVVVS